MSLLDVIPGLREAQEQDREARHSEALSLGSNVLGVSLRTMTVRDFAYLSGIRSPFICGGFIRREDCRRLLILMHKWYRVPVLFGFRAWLARRCVDRAIGKIRTPMLIEELRKWIDEVCFMDSGGGGGGVDEADYGTLAGILNALAINYGWTPETVYSLPMAMVLQLNKARADWNGAKRSRWNLRQDRCRAKFLEARNQ